MSEKPVISIVSPAYNEEEGIVDFINAVADVMAGGDLSWELVIVNDGSRDRTLEILQEKSQSLEQLVWVDLSRNFGHQAAVTAAIDHSVGDAVVVMDADMQDPPALIPQLISSWQDGHQVVFARRTQRAETGMRRVGFALFHKFFRYAIAFPIPRNVGVFSLLDRRAVNEIKNLPESNRFLPGLYSWVGFKQGFVDYARDERSAGAPKQTFQSLFKYAFDGVLSFSYKPIRFLGGIGLLTAFSAFAIAVYFTARRLLGHEVAFTGFTTLVILISMLGGLILVAIALVGEYIARIYDEVKQRPMYIVQGTARDSESS
ncbi:glycosyltransferase family 2 protein [Persicirhabdus sediminis]|uniref:Glycosyltransferase family 2 protein n=1 Tax=Persicirhabdus sediminis TaxID=454144 RepID=A0A8J7MBX6_9BACT|nr:glycosyltransferase family 2 protein [Persicirhabdus sediminis]MBK1790223.1 glycosyltransferase family 2 protein [Persicirhabdus sediminis]